MSDQENGGLPPLIIARKKVVGAQGLRVYKHVEQSEEHKEIVAILCPDGLMLMPSRGYDEVFPGIFISDLYSAKNLDFIKALGFTHVLNCCEGPGINQCVTGLIFYSETCVVNYLGLQLNDSETQSITECFALANTFINSCLHAQGKILVHCREGFSRSSTIVLAYLMSTGMQLKLAVKQLRDHREIGPNDGFISQLIEYNKRLFCLPQFE